MSWVSDAARALWEPKMAALARLAPDLALAAAEADPHHVWAAQAAPEDVYPVMVRGTERGLAVELCDTPPPGAIGVVSPGRARWVIAGSPRAVAEYLRLREGGAGPAADLAGIPACCQALHERLPREALSPEDLVWDWAGAPADAGTIEVEGAPEANPLLSGLGLSLLPYMPCSPGCAASIARTRRVVELGRSRGLGDSLDAWIRILSFPIAWSALHGIAEIKTPVLKMVTSATPTARLLRVHWMGGEDAAEAARGLHFPYLPPLGRARRGLRLVP